MPRRPRFAFLVVGALTFALIFAALQERVFLIDGFRFGGYMTLLTQIAFFVAATIERYVTGDLQRRAPWKLYVVLSIFTAGGMCVCGVAPSVWIATKLRCTVPSFSLVAVPSAAAGASSQHKVMRSYTLSLAPPPRNPTTHPGMRRLFTNWSLSFINYPTRVMFKASKVVPVMVVGVYLGKRFSALEVINVCALVVGICVFMYGNLRGSLNFDPVGVVLISLGVLSDAVTANIEEAYLFRAHQCSHAEVMAFTSLLGAVWSAAVLIVSGELAQGLQHTRTHPQTPVLIALFSIAGYAGVSFVLLLIKHFGATSAEMVKSSRKVLSIVLSFVLFAKPWNYLHVLGGVLFTAAITMQVSLKLRKRGSGGKGRKKKGRKAQRGKRRGDEEDEDVDEDETEDETEDGDDLEGGGVRQIHSGKSGRGLGESGRHSAFVRTKAPQGKEG